MPQTIKPVENNGHLMAFLDRISQLTNSIDIQIMINTYLQDLTGSPCVFLVGLLQSNLEGLVQVVGENSLAKEIRFPIPNTDFISIKIDEIFVEHKDVSPELAKVIELATGKKEDMQVFLVLNGLSMIESEQAAVYVCVAGAVKSPSIVAQQISETFRYVLGHLATSIFLSEEKLVNHRYQDVMNSAQRLLSQIADLDSLLRCVLTEAKNMMKAERCTLFLLDEYTGELVSKRFDGDTTTTVIRVEPGKGIVGKVAQTSHLVNVRDITENSDFNKSIDELVGLQTRNILCFPICHENRVIGVVELHNKENGLHFDICDEDIAHVFSEYFGISIMHSKIHKQMQTTEARQKISQEILSYQNKDCVAEGKKLILSMITPAFGLPTSAQLVSFDYNARDTDRALMARLSMQMFIDSDFVETFKLPKDKLATFVLTVQRGYRENPYHNWRHAFSAAHFAFTVVQNLKLVERGFITKLDALSILIATLCHDLDHRGKTNKFQGEAQTPLAALYSSEGSILERHHIAQTFGILNDENTRILDGLDDVDFKTVIDNIRQLILATDIATHIKLLKTDLKKLNMNNISMNKQLFMGLIMTCADLSDQTRPWTTNQEVANLVLTEFFAEGDMERQMGLVPDKLYERRNACVPQLELGFIDYVAAPTFKIFTDMFGESQRFMDTIHMNRKNWLDRRAAEQCGNGLK